MTQDTIRAALEAAAIALDRIAYRDFRGAGPFPSDVLIGRAKADAKDAAEAARAALAQPQQADTTEAVQRALAAQQVRINRLNALLTAMQDDAATYLVPDNECGADWFVNRMLWHLDGPEQRAAQAAPQQAAPAGQAEAPAAMPRPGSPEASAMIDAVLAEYGWPANPKNAARAGFEAAIRMLASSNRAPAAEAVQPPTQAVLLTDEAIAELATQEQFLLICDGLAELTGIAADGRAARRIGMVLCHYQDDDRVACLHELLAARPQAQPTATTKE